jgi:hypothetical protein
MALIFIQINGDTMTALCQQKKRKVNIFRGD